MEKIVSEFNAPDTRKSFSHQSHDHSKEAAPLPPSFSPVIPMSDETQLIRFRMSFEILRFAPLIALAILPFTFSDGPISWALFAGAIPISAAWLTSSVMAWRKGEEIWCVLPFLVLVLGSRWAGVHDAAVSNAQFVQWLCVVITLTGAPLLLFRDRLYRYARLDVPDGRVEGLS